MFVYFIRAEGEDGQARSDEGREDISCGSRLQCTAYYLNKTTDGEIDV